MDEILNSLIDQDLRDYKCFDLLKKKIETDHELRSKIIEGYDKGLISKFPRDLFDKVCNLNLRAPFDMEQLFIDGANIGNCTKMSIIVSYAMSGVDICGGTLKILENTKNSIDGSHTWISSRGKIIDTSLMLFIDEKISKELGYNEENRYNPNMDSIYLAEKAFANDKSIKR